MTADFTRRLLAYFDELAPAYVSDIEPVFQTLIADFIAAARLQPHDRVLDLGTGTGLAARLAAEHTAFVAAMDFSPAMVSTAAGLGTPNVVRGDMHALPFRSAAFDAVLAVLAFNSTDPALSMPEACRVLGPGGMLGLQEWGTTDPLSRLLEETLAEYAVEDPPPELGARREERFAYHPWDELETSEDIVTMLESTGFGNIRVEVVSPDVELSGPEVFIRYKLAWPFRREEVAAMPGEVRRLFLSDLAENLGALTGPGGTLRWQPNLIRVFARRPG